MGALRIDARPTMCILFNAKAEAGLPFVDGKDGTPTNKVHCYGTSWAVFLDSKYEPVTFSVFQ